MCSPQKLTESDTLILKMAQPHGSELAVISPAGEYYMIAYQRIDRRSPLRPIMSSDEFKKLTEFRIDPKSFKAHPWKDGADKYQKVFTAPGRYRVLLSDNLETDDSTPMMECIVNYQIEHN